MRRELVLALVCGCSLPGVDLEGQYVRVAADPGLEPCGGTLAHMDAFVARVAEEFGVAPPTGNDRIKFYWLEESRVKRKCRREVEGCALGSKKVYSKKAPLNHELVHSLAARWGRHPPFFQEGLAVAFEGLGKGVALELEYLVWEDVSSVEVEADMLSAESLDVDYATAGAFIHFLVERHGTGAVLSTIKRLPVKASRADINGAFQAGLG